MALYPNAKDRKIAKWQGRKMSAYNLAILHVTASEAPSQYGYFSNTDKACSHFHVDKAGNIEQYIDTAYKDASSYNANGKSIGIETQGLAGGAWTPQQVEALARLLAWCNTTHGIPLELVPDSGAYRRGVGYHSQGVPATRLQKARRISQTGGQLWSNAVGKVCPGSARVRQIPEILAKAKKYAGQPVPNFQPVNTGLALDGWAGTATIRKAQQIAGTPIDGIVSGQPIGNKKYLPRFASVDYTSACTGSMLVSSLQAHLKVRVDGWLGKQTVTALQHRLGVNPDGYAGAITVTAWQRKLNEGKLF